MHLVTFTCDSTCTWWHSHVTVHAPGDIHMWQYMHLVTFTCDITCSWWHSYVTVHTPGDIHMWQYMHLVTFICDRTCTWWHSHVTVHAPGDIHMWHYMHLVTFTCNSTCTCWHSHVAFSGNNATLLHASLQGYLRVVFFAHPTEVERIWEGFEEWEDLKRIPQIFLKSIFCQDFLKS